MHEYVFKLMKIPNGVFTESDIKQEKPSVERPNDLTKRDSKIETMKWAEWYAMSLVCSVEELAGLPFATRGSGAGSSGIKTPLETERARRGLT